jgi:hypothetical protein
VHRRCVGFVHFCVFIVFCNAVFWIAFCIAVIVPAVTLLYLSWFLHCWILMAALYYHMCNLIEYITYVSWYCCCYFVLWRAYLHIPTRVQCPVVRSPRWPMAIFMCVVRVPGFLTSCALSRATPRAHMYAQVAGFMSN